MASPLAEYEVCLGFDSPLITPGGNLLNASNDHRLILLSPACLPSSSPPPPFFFIFLSFNRPCKLVEMFTKAAELEV